MNDPFPPLGRLEYVGASMLFFQFEKLNELGRRIDDEELSETFDLIARWATYTLYLDSSAVIEIRIEELLAELRALSGLRINVLRKMFVVFRKRWHNELTQWQIEEFRRKPR